MMSLAISNEIKEVTEVPGMGWFGSLVDPGGSAFALWQPEI
jgi:predicted enzyme related to lactoylglutathione lyase